MLRFVAIYVFSTNYHQASPRSTTCSTGVQLCDFYVWSDVLCCTASILHLVSIALDRYWAVTNTGYAQKRTARRIGIMIAVCWLLAAAISLPARIDINRLKDWLTSSNTSQILVQTECQVNQDIAFTIFSTVGAFYMPMLFIIAIYIRIYIVARSRIRRSKFTSKSCQFHPDESLSCKGSRCKLSWKSFWHMCCNVFAAGIQPTQETTSERPLDCSCRTEKGKIVMVIDNSTVWKHGGGYCTSSSKAGNRSHFCSTQTSGRHHLCPHLCCSKPRTRWSPENITNENASKCDNFSELIERYPKFYSCSAPATLNRPSQTSQSWSSSFCSNDSSTEASNSSFECWSSSFSEAPHSFKWRNHLREDVSMKLRRLLQNRDAGQRNTLQHLPHIRINPMHVKDFNLNVADGRKSCVPRSSITKYVCCLVPNGKSIEVRRDESKVVTLRSETFTQSGDREANSSALPTEGDIGSGQLYNGVQNDSQGQGPTETTSAVATRRERLERERERKAAITLSIITGCFILCWLPFFIEALLEPFDTGMKITEFGRSLFLWLGYSNSLLNPVIYTIFSPDFRHAFHKILFGRYKIFRCRS